MLMQMVAIDYFNMCLNMGRPGCIFSSPLSQNFLLSVLARSGDQESNPSLCRGTEKC